MTETCALIRSPEPVAWWHWFLAALLSGVVAYVTIAWFLKWVGRIGLLPFVIYRILLGGFILAVFL